MRDIIIHRDGNETVVHDLKEVDQVSMRKGTLKAFGGDLDNLYDSKRFDSNARSRKAYHRCHKDKRVNGNRLFDRKTTKRLLSMLKSEIIRSEISDELEDEWISIWT